MFKRQDELIKIHSDLSHPSLESNQIDRSGVLTTKDGGLSSDTQTRTHFCSVKRLRNVSRLSWLIGVMILTFLVAGSLALGLLLKNSQVAVQGPTPVSTQSPAQSATQEIPKDTPKNTPKDKPKENTPERNSTVDLGYSKYIGVDADIAGVTKWLGIRYAAPPTGNLRFRAPVDPKKESKTHVANKHAPLCHSTPSTTLNTSTSEDCLFLDVYAPNSTSRLHPVYIFIQGGGLNQLANPNIDGSNLIKAGDFDIVVVTFNYRVGPFGFLASKEIRENGDLNVGLLDQRKVFEWVQKHIEKFGGDPKHVTIGGSSAGAGAVALHLTAYGGRDDGLFHAAAAGSPSLGAKFTVEESQFQYDTLIKRVNCSSTTDTLQCLRKLDIKTFVENNQNIPTAGGAGGLPVFPYTNVIDGNFTISNAYSLFTSGKFIQIPVIFGDDTDEGTVFSPSSTDSLPQMNNFLKDNFPKLDQEQLDRIDAYYPKEDQFAYRGQFWSSTANAYGEMRYICPGIHLSSQYSIRNISQSWNFRWNVLEHNNLVSGLGVTHTSDLGSIWGTAEPPEEALIPTMQSYWTSFIRTYNPNTYKLPEVPVWETFNVKNMSRLHILDVGKLNMEGVDPSQRERCAYLESQSQKLRM